MSELLSMGWRNALYWLLAAVIVFTDPSSTLAQVNQEVNMAEDQSNTDVTATPAWLEPRGLAAIELVGQVPDQYLRGTILSQGDTVGIVVYESGSRVGSEVVVTTTIYPRLLYPYPGVPMTYFGCLGQEPHFDHMGSVVPASSLRLYTPAGAEVTADIRHMYLIYMNRLQPSAGSLAPFRYPLEGYGPGLDHALPLQPDGLHIPDNSGCRIAIMGADYRRLTGVFTFQVEPRIQAQVLGTQQAIFGSYIGPGNVGIFSPLMKQLNNTYGHRWWRIPLSIPKGANYFLLRYPPMPGDAYTDRVFGQSHFNADRPSSGTYRLVRNTAELSADLTISAAFPLERAWRDADQVAGTFFLPTMEDLTELEPPEYLLPAGIPYNDCFTRGDCPPPVLDQIYNKEMSLEIIYLSITEPWYGGEWVSLRMAGPTWSSSSQTTAPAASAQAKPLVRDQVATSGVNDVSTATHMVFLPFIVTAAVECSAGCPCGWFDSKGRMLGFSP